MFKDTENVIVNNEFQLHKEWKTKPSFILHMEFKQRWKRREKKRNINNEPNGSYNDVLAAMIFLMICFGYCSKTHKNKKP